MGAEVEDTGGQLSEVTVSAGVGTGRRNHGENRSYDKEQGEARHHPAAVQLDVVTEVHGVGKNVGVVSCGRGRVGKSWADLATFAGLVSRSTPVFTFAFLNKGVLLQGVARDEPGHPYVGTGEQGNKLVNTGDQTEDAIATAHGTAAFMQSALEAFRKSAFDLWRELLVKARENVKSESDEHEAGFVKGDEAAQIALLHCQLRHLLATAGAHGTAGRFCSFLRPAAWPPLAFFGSKRKRLQRKWQFVQLSAR